MGYGRFTDIRATHFRPRPFDQKVTPDIVLNVSRIISSLYGTPDKSFTRRELVAEPSFEKVFIYFFGKPKVESKSFDEYYALVSQITNFLESSEIIQSTTKAKKNKVYKVHDYEDLSLVCGDITCVEYMSEFFEKVLRDSGAFWMFDEYLSIGKTRRPVNSEYCLLRDRFRNFLACNSGIKKVYEPRRIIGKVLNVLAFTRRVYGSRGGTSSTELISFPDLCYARENARDSDKLKSESRADNTADISLASKVANTKSYVRSLWADESIFTGHDPSGVGMEIHRIVPESYSKMLAACAENMVPLSPNEHSLIHKGGRLDKEMTKTLLQRQKEFIEFGSHNSRPGANKSFNMSIFMKVVSEAKAMGLLD